MVQLSKKDYAEFSDLAILIKKIDHLDANYVDVISDEIYLRHPFYLTVLMGYRLDLKESEFEEIARIFILIWQYFRQNKNVQKKKVTQRLFEKKHLRYMQMLKYIDGEPDQESISKIYDDDLQKLQSKSLLAAIAYRLTTRPDLIKMHELEKAYKFIDIITFIECFESL